MTKNSKVDKYIYYFLKYVDLEDFWAAFHYLQNKYKLEEGYLYLIVEECIKCNYIDGVKVDYSSLNGKSIVVLNRVYVTRKGYQFINDYNLKKINFFWIPLKNLIIIIVTAIITSIITAFVTYLFKN